MQNACRYVVNQYGKSHSCTAKVSEMSMAYELLLDFSLTVKAAALIFISGHGSAISSAKEGKSGFIRANKLFEPRKRVCIS